MWNDRLSDDTAGCDMKCFRWVRVVVGGSMACFWGGFDEDGLPVFLPVYSACLFCSSCLVICSGESSRDESRVK